MNAIQNAKPLGSDEMPDREPRRPGLTKDAVLVSDLLKLLLKIRAKETGVFLYFIAGGANEEQRDKGKQLVFWGITAFVVMSCLWGLVNLLTNTFGFGGYNNPRPPSFSPTGQPATQNAPANTGSGNTPFNASGNAPAN